MEMLNKLIAFAHRITPISIYSGPTSGGVGTFKTRRREVPGSDPGRTSRPSRSEISVVFSKTRVNTGPVGT